MTEKELVALLKGLAPVIERRIFEHVSPVAERLKTAEAKLAALETAQQKTLADAFRGTWMPGTVFARGSLTVHDGSTWLALVDSGQRPGASADWKMLARAGRPGKDATP